MSYASLSSHGLGVVETPPDDANAAAEYLKARWTQFAGMYPQILDLQHRAAEVALALDRQGDHRGAEQARAVIKRMGEIAQAHNEIVYRAETVGEYIGLSGYRGLGAIQIPIAAGVTLVALATLMAWVISSTYGQAEILRLIEAGVLTPEQAVQLDAGSRPGAVLGDVTQLGTLAVIGFGLWLSWQFLEARGFLKKGGRRRRAKRNPPLVVFKSNPPANAQTIGDRVYALFYRHAEDGDEYVHEFDEGVDLQAMDDGTVCLEQRDGLPLWDDFEVIG